MSATEHHLRSNLVVDDEFDGGPRSHPLVDVSVDSDDESKSRKASLTPPLSSPSTTSSSSSSSSSAFRARASSDAASSFAELNEHGELHSSTAAWGWANRAWATVSGRVANWGRSVLQLSNSNRPVSQSVDENPLIPTSGTADRVASGAGEVALDDDSDEAVRQRATQSDEVVIINNVHKTYLLGIEGVPALRGVSLRIRRGEFLVILGSSGGGKTSLLNLIGSIDRPTKGEIIICGERLTSNTPDEVLANLRLTHLGFVFQTFNLISSMTAFENVCLPMILKAELAPKEIETRAKELLTRVGLANRMDHLPSQLSGGEQQRVTIARALANRPSVLLLDEPTGDLDTKNSVIILSLLLHLNRFEEISCIMVTHDQSLSLYGHRIVNMLDGKIVRITHTTEESRKNAESELAEKLALLQHQQREKDKENGTNSIQQLEALHNDWMSWSGHTNPPAKDVGIEKQKQEEEEKKKSVEDSRAVVAEGYARTEIRNPDKYYSFLLQE